MMLYMCKIITKQKKTECLATNEIKYYLINITLRTKNNVFYQKIKKYHTYCK